MWWSYVLGKRDIYSVVGEEFLFRVIESQYINSVIFLFFTVSSSITVAAAAPLMGYTIQYSCLGKKYAIIFQLQMLALQAGPGLSWNFCSVLASWDIR